jgi:predicted lipoprotein
MAKETTNVYWEDVEENQALPETTRKIDYQLIAVGAIWATHDHMPVHHETAFAQQAGAPDIFMNILTSNGLAAAYLEQWAGPAAQIKKMTAGLQVPNFPDDEMVMSGKVIRKWEEGNEKLIEISYSGDNSMATHITGTAVMSLPARG